MTGIMRVEGFCVNGDGPYSLGVCHSLALWGGSLVDQEGKTVAMVNPIGGWLGEDGGGVYVDELRIASRTPIAVAGGDAEGRRWRKATTRRQADVLRLTSGHVLCDAKSGEAVAEFDGSSWRLPDADTELVILD